MSHCAEFQIIGRIGQIKKVGTTLRVTIASGYPYKDDRGEWQERTRWNEITVFNDARQSYVQRNLKAGDLVRATGVLEQTSWEKNGFVRATAGRLRWAQHAKNPAAIRPRGRSTRPTRRSAFVCRPGG